MTSKNSFWVSLKENNKRRVWLWILSAFAYLVMLPTITALIISSCKTNNMYLIEQFGEIAGTESIRKETMAQLKFPKRFQVDGSEYKRSFRSRRISY